jgi:acyl-CoA reductase-like NAD-dependent aldehyde dehydrogenase
MKTAQHDNLIAGGWKKAPSYSLNIDPSNLADAVAEYAQGGAGDVNAAMAAATAAFPAWATGSIQARSDALDKIGTEILARREELRHCQAGMMMVNLPTAGVDYHVPFGGRRKVFTAVKTAYTDAN